MFNCQMGRGRTTTAMIIAALVRCRLHPEQQPRLSLTRQTSSSEDERLMLQGDYAVVRSLVRVVEGGKEAKEAADKVRQSEAVPGALHPSSESARRSLTAVRTCKIFARLFWGTVARWVKRRVACCLRARANLGSPWCATQADEKRREAALLRGVEYLERYYTLIAFAAYVHHPSFDGSAFNSEEGSFQAWLDKRPELQSILRRMLWRNPMGALMPPTLPLPGIVVAQQLPPDGGEAADAVVSGRAGGVLGAHCILKEEPYPGVQSGRVPVFHEGAPNFRQVLRLSCTFDSHLGSHLRISQAMPYPVYGVAISTLDGIRAVLAAAGAATSKGAPVQWYNMREEPCIYIAGRPFVLREAMRPLANLCECARPLTCALVLSRC